MTTEVETTELAVRRNGAELLVKNPVRPDEYAPTTAVATSIAQAITEVHRRRREFGEVTADNWIDADKFRRELEDEDKRLLAYQGEMSKAALELLDLGRVKAQLSGAKTRIDPMSLRGVIRATAKALGDEIEPFKTAARPKATPRTWVITINATDDQFAEVAEAAKKAGCPIETYATPQTDKAVKEISAWFGRNCNL